MGAFCPSKPPANCGLLCRQARAARKRRDLQREVLYTLPVTPRAGEQARARGASVSLSRETVALL